MNKPIITIVAAGLLGLTASAAKAPSEVWSIGRLDGSPNEFALAPSGFRDFLAKDFGYEDKYYITPRNFCRC